MRTIQVLLASRLRVIGASICLLFLCSCISISLYDQWYGDTSVRPDIPPEVSFDKRRDARLHLRDAPFGGR